MKLMVIGAHALDAEVMGGAMALKYAKKGHNSIIVHMTRGERGNPNKTQEEFGLQVEKEMQEVASALQSRVHWMGYLAAQFSRVGVLQYDLCDYIREEKPDIIITHWRGSLHPKHVATHYAVVSAVKLAFDEKVKRAAPPHKVKYLYFGENCEDLNGFIPQVYVDISDELEEWIDAMKRYELFRGGLQSVPYETYYRTTAKIRGIECGLKEAQGFMVASRVQQMLHHEE